MKKNFLYILLLGGALLTGTTSCEDRLDIPKHGNMGGQTDFYKTDAEAMQALTSLYVAYSGTYYNWYMTKNLLADDVWCGGGSRGDNADMERLNEYSFDTDHGMIQGLYSGYYGIIYNANLIIDLMQPDTEVKARAVAEAKFFRAWAHFELVTLFGTAPVVDHLLKPDEYKLPNSTPEQLWTRVETDLGDAISSQKLPSKQDVNDAETTIRVTHEVAQAMLAKAYLFQGKYPEAAALFDQVIASKKYDLYRGDYDMLLHAAADNSCEAMLEIQKRNDPEHVWDSFTMTHIMQGWRTDKLSVSGEAGQVIANGTYGFLNPRKALYDAFVQTEGKDGYRLNSTMRTAEQMEAFGVKINPGVAWDGHEGIYMWKNRALKEDCIIDNSGFQVAQYINLRVMRYAEVLLMAAEAHVLGGDKGKALTYINEVRSRAQVAPLNSVTLADVKNEKRLELCLECVRYQDLVRWGDAGTLMAEQGKEIPTYSSTGVTITTRNTTYGFKPKHKLLPIPLKELELNPNMKPNEGW